jgi:hypothetical protein
VSEPENLPQSQNGLALIPADGPASGLALLGRLEQAKFWLVQCTDFDEIKQIEDIAEAARQYALVHGLGRDAMNLAAEVKLRADRRRGDLLAVLCRRGPRPRNGRGGTTIFPGLAALGITKDDSYRSQRLASIPAETFDRHVALVREDKKAELTTAGVLQLVPRKPKPSRAPAPVPLIPPGDRYRVDCADCLDWFAGEPENSIDLVFGSPPYEQARLYLENGEDRAIARDTADWVSWMADVFQAALRCCTGLVAFVVEGQTENYRWSAGPALLMAELHRRGVTMRKPPVYKRSGIPGSGGPDWLRNDYEFIVCATNGGRLQGVDNTAMGQPPKYGPGGDPSHRKADGSRANEDRPRAATGRRPGKDHRREGVYVPPGLANPGNVIDCGAAGGGNIGDKICHENEAPFPEYLAEFMIRTFCPPAVRLESGGVRPGIVCDPFSGSGTTGAMAVRLARRFVGCDLRQSQVDLSLRRMANAQPPLPTQETLP